MTYSVKEIFYTLQGEGAQRRHAGGVLPLCRLQPVDRPRADRAAAVCSFCDTDFVGTDGAGGGKFARGRTRWRDAIARAMAGAARRRTASSSSPAASRCCSSTPR